MYKRSARGLFRVRYAPAIALALLALAALVAGGSRTAVGAAITVNTTADELNSDGDCSLREAVRAANTNAAVDACTAGGAGSDTINIPAGTYTVTIAGQNENAALTGDLDITSTFLTVAGAGAASTAIDGGGLDRVFDIQALIGGVTISGVTIRNGYANGGNGGGMQVGNSASVTLSNVAVDANLAGLSGGGINVAGALTVTGSTVSNNLASSGASTGGGINIATGSGTLAMTNSTVSGNAAGGAGGGGISNYHDATLTNVTVAGNTASNGGGKGGGVYASGFGAVTTLKNTIVAGNAASTGANCNGTITSNGHNLDSGGTCAFGGTGDISNADPLLGALADNGGPTQTHSLPGNSPATNAGDNTGCPAADQRGVLRPQYAVCDIGAYEYDGASPPPTPSPTPVPTPSPTATPVPTPTPTHTATPTPTPTPPPSTPTPPPPTPTPTPPPPTPTPPPPTPTPTPTPPGQTPTPTPTPTATGTATPTPTATPPGQTPGPTATEIPTPAATPTPTPSDTGAPGEYLWADADCDARIDAVDALAFARFVAGLPPLTQNEPCPDVGARVQITEGLLPWGDADCDRDVDAVDALKVLRHVAGLAAGQTEPCPDIGATVQASEG